MASSWVVGVAGMHPVPTTEFAVEPPTLEIASGWTASTLELSAAPSAAAGSIWQGSGRRSGHQVCWRISGAVLELSETTLLPGITIVDAERRIRFPNNLLPSVGLAQLDDDALLVSVVMHAPSGGVFVYQMRFGAPADPALVQGAVVRRASWFKAPPESAPSTPEPVGTSVGVPVAAAFEMDAEKIGARAWRTSLLLGGDSAHAVCVSLHMDLGQPTQGIVAAELTVRACQLSLPCARVRVRVRICMAIHEAEQGQGGWPRAVARQGICAICAAHSQASPWRLPGLATHSAPLASLHSFARIDLVSAACLWRARRWWRGRSGCPSDGRCRCTRRSPR